MNSEKDRRVVWVRSRDRHTPAHRIPDDAIPDTDDPPVVAISCPPFLMTGGRVVTPRAAARIEAFPCTKCFPAGVWPR